MVALLRSMSGLVAALALFPSVALSAASSSSFGSQPVANAQVFQAQEFQRFGGQTPRPQVAQIISQLPKDEIKIEGKCGLSPDGESYLCPRRWVVIHRTNAQGAVVRAQDAGAEMGDNCAANEQVFNDACGCGVCWCSGLPNLPRSGAEEHLEVLEDDEESGSEYLTLLRAAIGLEEPVTTQETRWQKLVHDHPRTTKEEWMSRDVQRMMSGVTIDRLGIFFLRGRGGECTLLNKNFRITSVLVCRSGGLLCWTLQSSMFSEERILRSMQHGTTHDIWY